MPGWRSSGCRPSNWRGRGVLGFFPLLKPLLIERHARVAAASTMKSNGKPKVS